MDIKYLTLAAPILSWFIAQILKPFTHFFKTGIWDLGQIKASGGLPSSHTAAVSSVALSIGLKDGFDSSLFALSAVLCCIVAYDAMNVRYFAGENIRVTKKLIEELSTLLPKLLLDDGDDLDGLKEVLGHTVVEVCSGFILGLIITGCVMFLVK